MVRDYVKISEQDLLLAEEFFENEKHFSEWLLNVFNYYRGKDVKIKTKIVQRYFNNYKKTMDFIINSVKTGKDGGEKSAENQRVKSDTLGGVVGGVVAPMVVDTVPPNSKDKIVNSKTVKENDFELFWSKYPKKVAKDKCKKKFLSLSNDDIETIKNTIDGFLSYKPFPTYNHPNPETYLNQKRWQDEATEEKTQSTEMDSYNPDSPTYIHPETRAKMEAARKLMEQE